MKCLVILAGGKSSRMGKDKVMLPVQGTTFIERIFSNALVCFDRIIISTDTDAHARQISALPEIAKAGPEIVTDAYECAGPIGGILSVFEKTDADRFAIISVDVPKADMNVLAALYDKAEGKAAFLKIGDGKREPLIAAYDRSSYEDLKASYEAGCFKLGKALGDGITVIEDGQLRKEIPALKDTDFSAAFKNYNTQEDLDLC